MLDLRFLQIEKIVVHHVNSRAADRAYVKPWLDDKLTNLAPPALDMFNRRIAQALGNSSHGIQMDFRQVAAGSFFQKAAEIMRSDEAQFIALSKTLAEDLTEAQQSRDLAPSKLIVVAGHVGQYQRPFMAAIKAEMQDGLGDVGKAGRAVIQHLTNIFLTESQRLYKIGFVQQTAAKPTQENGMYDPGQFVVHMFDHYMTGTETRGAAIYFYSSFMGADISKSDKRLTQDFYEKTTQFFDSQQLAPAQRIDLGEALRSELKSNDQTLGVAQFAKKHLPKPMQKEYAEFMTRAKFPNHAITKNTEYINSKLKRRQKAVFSSGVQITAPADKFKDLVTIATAKNGVTTVTIQGTVEHQE